MRSTFADLYTDVLWWMMDQIGVTKSVERKVVAAVVIQFSISVTLVLVSLVFGGLFRIGLTIALLGVAVVAFINTIIITRWDIIEPIEQLETHASSIAEGDFSTDITRIDQDDELGELTDEFADMQSYLDLVASQADALARQEFEADVLDRDVPGEFGRSLREMNEGLTEYAQELQATTDRLERRSDRLDELVSTFGERAKRARDGDLTATIDQGTFQEEGDAYQDVIDNYNALVTTLAETLGDVVAFAERVDAASDDVDASITEVSDASDEVARSIQEISEGAADQTDQLQTVSEAMNDLSATVQEIAASADEVAETASIAAERGQTGQEATNEAIEELQTLEARIDDTASAVEQLAEEIREIDEIVNLIDEIAAETNMLALNASIEAARAGEAGEGFAVVAEDIKGLAEETADAAGDISDRIETVQMVSESTVKDAGEMTDQVGTTAQSVRDAVENFEDIVSLVEEIDGGLEEISAATDDQAQTATEVVDLVDEVASISEQTTAEAEDVAAAAQQQTATIESVTDAVEDLSTDAATLVDRLGAFTIESDTGRRGVATRSVTESAD